MKNLKEMEEKLEIEKNMADEVIKQKQEEYEDKLQEMHEKLQKVEEEQKFAFESAINRAEIEMKEKLETME
jgi:hypothetical protein